MRRLALLFVASLALVGAGAQAQAAPAKGAAAKAAPTPVHKNVNDKGTFKQCEGKKCHKAAVFQGHNAAKTTYRTEPLEKPSGTIAISAENLGESTTLNIYKPDGSFDEASLAKLDDMYRCVKTGEVRAVRAELYEQLSRIYDHFGGKQIQLVSGFRFAERDSSRHFHASAMDIRVADTSFRDVYAFAETLDMGNMGIGQYPTTGFVHIDFRAPGEPSYRWTDYSGHGSGPGHAKKPAKKPTGHTQPARKPVS